MYNKNRNIWLVGGYNGSAQIMFSTDNGQTWKSASGDTNVYININTLTSCTFNDSWD